MVFEGVEILDFCGPFEVFSPPVGPMEVVLVTAHPPDEDDANCEGSKERPIVTVGGMKVVPHVNCGNCPPLDVLVVPGGRGAEGLKKDEAAYAEAVDFVRRQSLRVEVVAAVCTGAFLLAETGLLDGRRATTHFKALDRFRDAFPEIDVVRDKHWTKQQVSSGENSYTLFTSAGISAGIDVSLKIVEELYGEAVARGAAQTMEYPYPETNERRIEL